MTVKLVDVILFQFLEVRASKFMYTCLKQNSIMPTAIAYPFETNQNSIMSAALAHLTKCLTYLDCFKQRASHQSIKVLSCCYSRKQMLILSKENNI